MTDDLTPVVLNYLYFEVFDGGLMLEGLLDVVDVVVKCCCLSVYSLLVVIILQKRS